MPSQPPPSHKDLLKDLSEIEKDSSLLDGATKRIHAVLAVENHVRDLDRYYENNPNEERAPQTIKFCKYVDRLTKYDDKEATLIPLELRHELLLACAHQFSEPWEGELPNHKRVESTSSSSSLPPKKKRKREDRWAKAKTTYCRSVYAGLHNMGPLAAMTHSHETENSFQVSHYGCKTNTKGCPKDARCPFQARLFFKATTNDVKLKDYTGQVAVQQLREHTCQKRDMTWTEYLKDPSMRGMHPLVKEAVMNELTESCKNSSRPPKPGDVVRRVKESYPEAMSNDVATQIENLAKREIYKMGKGKETTTPTTSGSAMGHIGDVITKAMEQHLQTRV